MTDDADGVSIYLAIFADRADMCRADGDEGLFKTEIISVGFADTFRGGSCY